jgi:hypothetical protein
LPIPQRVGSDFPIVQYAYDTLLVLEACPTKLQSLKELMHTFSASTWLKVNYNKSVMVPLNLDEGKLNDLANAFGFQTGSLPFTYLGLPLGNTKPSYPRLHATNPKSPKKAELHILPSISR